VSIRETSGITFGDDTNTAATIATWTPSTNALSLAIAGSGTFTITTGDKMAVDRIEGTGSSVTLAEDIVAIADGANANATTFTPASETLIVDVNGANGHFKINSGDVLDLGSNAGTPAGAIVGSNWYDSTRKMHAAIGDSSSSASMRVQQIFSSGDSNTIASTAALTAFTFGGSNLTVGSGYASVVGRTFLIEALGIYSLLSTDTVTLRCDIGGCAFSGNTVGKTNTEANKPFKVLVIARVTTAGASGSVFGTIHSYFDGGAGDLDIDMSGGQTASGDLTGTPEVKLSATFSASSASNSIQIKAINIYEVN
jgi:hypothetical protein